MGAVLGRMGERVDCLVPAIGGCVGHAQVLVDGVLALERRGEVECGAVGLDGVDRTAHLHEAAAQAAQGAGGIGVGLVDGGVAVGHASLAEVADLAVGVAESHIGLVGRGVLGILGRHDERGDGLLRLAGRKQGAASVGCECPGVPVRRVGKGVPVCDGRLVVVAKLHEAVAQKMVDSTGNLARLLCLLEPPDGATRSP